MKQRNHTILTRAAAMIIGAAAALSMTFNVLAAVPFASWKDAGSTDGKRTAELTIRLNPDEEFEESATVQLGFKLTTKDGKALAEEHCSFVFDSGLPGTVTVRDYRYLGEGEIRLTLSGRKNADGSGGILTKNAAVTVGKLSVSGNDQETELVIIEEECKAVDERGSIVPISQFGDTAAYIFPAQQSSGNEPENPENPENPGSGGGSGGGGRRHGGSSSASSVNANGPGPAVEARGSWQAQADGTWRFLREDGSYAANAWIYVKGLWYRMGADGIMLTGWYEENGNVYYLKAYGAMTIGWRLIDNSWYYMGTDGIMKTGWQLIDGLWYYLNPIRPVPQLVFDQATGVVLTDPVTWAPITTTEGQRPYGEMYKSTVTPDGYVVNENGAWVPAAENAPVTGDTQVQNGVF